MEDFFVPSVVIDVGSHSCKAGLGGEDIPRIVIPTQALLQSNTSQKIIPASEHVNATQQLFEHKLIFGNDCWNESTQANLYSSLLYPVQNGVVKYFEVLDKYIEYIFEHPKLDVQAESQPVLLTEASENPKENRFKLAEMFFEKFKVPALYFGQQPIMDLLATGRTTGIVLDVGHTLTQVLPIFEGFALSHAAVRQEFGGYDLDLFLKILLQEKLAKKSPNSRDFVRKPGQGSFYKEADALDFDSIYGMKILSSMKEKLCSVSQNEKLPDLERDFILPDRTVITIDNVQIYKCPEALFSPNLISNNKPSILGIHEAVLKSFGKCDDHAKKLISQNVVLAGGSSLFEGMKDRLVKELNDHLLSQRGNEAYKMLVDVASEKRYSTWVGASLLASLSTFADMWISKSAYDEFGPNIAFSKFC